MKIELELQRVQGVLPFAATAIPVRTRAKTIAGTVNVCDAAKNPEKDADFGQSSSRNAVRCRRAGKRRYREHMGYYGETETYYFTPIDFRQRQRKDGALSEGCRNCGVPFAEHSGSGCPYIPNHCARCGLLDIDHVNRECPIQPY